MRKLLLVGCCLFPLGACSVSNQINTLALADANAALTLATTNKDQPMIDCATQLKTNAQADLNTNTAIQGVAAPHLLLTVELSRAEKANLGSLLKACADLASQYPGVQAALAAILAGSSIVP